MSKLIYLLSILFLCPFVSTKTTQAQDLKFDSLLISNSYKIEVNETGISGEGLEIILDKTKNTQFVSLTENHNVKEQNLFFTHLFETLHNTYQFNYIALEQGSVMGDFVGSTYRGNLNNISEFIGTYPYALTFATDQEIEMIANIGDISGSKYNPIWTIDQDFGALHILEKLLELTDDSSITSKIQSLIQEAKQYEKDRQGDTHYLSQVAQLEDYEELNKMFHKVNSKEAKKLSEALYRTVKIYSLNNSSSLESPTLYESFYIRELSMKKRFFEYYNEAIQQDHVLPKVLTKLGHFHTYRGIYRSNVSTFGNFLSEFAISNGKESYIITSFVINSPDSFRNSSAFIESVAIPDAQFTFIDLQSLRKYAHSGLIADLSEGYKDLLFQADALMIIRGGSTGSYNTAYNSN